jgi:uncharacterized protein (DUF983 family)
MDRPRAAEPAQIPASMLIRRALARRCPLCGRGALFRTHFRMNRECANCHAIFWKDPGESLGAMYVDYAVAAGAFLVAWPVLALVTNLSDLGQLVVLSVIAAGSVVVFYPFSRSIWTVLIYLSGGIERPPLQIVRGGKGSA